METTLVPNQKEKSVVKCKWNDCTKTFENDRRCLKHVRTEHSLTKTNGRCLWGNCEFSSNGYSVRNHVKKHFNIIEASCSVCDTVVFFKWRFDLNKHLKQFHPPGTYTIDIQSIDGFDVYNAITPIKSPMSESLAKILN